MRDRFRADALLGRAGVRARIGGPGARGGGASPSRREGERRRDDPRRPRDEGRLGRGPARPRAPRRLRAPVRGRPLSRASRPACRQEQVRLHERARRLRDDGNRPGRRAGSSALFGKTEAGEVGAAVACALEGTRPILLEIQSLVAPTDLAMPRRVGDRRRPEAPRDDRRRARPARRRRARCRRRLRERRRRRAHRRARRRPRDRARDCVGREGNGGSRRARRVRRGRPDRTAAPGDPGGAAPSGVREARPDARRRPRRDRRSWQTQRGGAADTCDMRSRRGLDAGQGR